VTSGELLLWWWLISDLCLRLLAKNLGLFSLSTATHLEPRSEASGRKVRWWFHSRSIDRPLILHLDWLPLSPLHTSFLVSCNGTISIENYTTSHQSTLTYQSRLPPGPYRVPATHVVQGLQAFWVEAQQAQYPGKLGPNGLVSVNIPLERQS